MREIPIVAQMVKDYYEVLGVHRDADAKPCLEKMPGWKTDITSRRKFEDLPKSARHYVDRIEELIGVPIKWISVGAERNALIKRFEN